MLAAHGLTTNERITPAKAAGVLVGFARVAMLIGPDAISGLGENLAAEAACLSAALAFASTGIYGRRFKSQNPVEVATGQLTGSTVTLIPFAALVDRPWALPMPSGAVWAAMVGIAVLCTVLAYALSFPSLPRPAPPACCW